MHVGHFRPDPSDAEVGTRPVRGRRSALVDPALDWHRHGLTPAWNGMETSVCAAALEPSVFHGQGADELHRFLEGVRSRGESAMAIITIGDAADDSPRSVMQPYNNSFHLPTRGNTIPARRSVIAGRRLPQGTRPELVPGLGPVEKDLGLRLRNHRPVEAPWWALKLIGELHGGVTGYKPAGELHPILVDGLGEPLVAVWISLEEDQRWYVIPDATDWSPVLDWLVSKALPAYVPGALRRVRSPHFDDPALLTAAEIEACQALEAEKTRHAAEKVRLQEVLNQAKAAADSVREGLLYGTGQELEDAVAAVLRAAGFTTVELDVELNGTRSADVLAVLGEHRLLVEVKSAGGEAGEKLVGALEKHLATWPQLRPRDPVSGAVLVVNHQHKMTVAERTPQVYRRPEFVASLPFPVLSTAALFEWWRMGDWAAIQKAMLNAVPPAAAPSPAVPSPPRPRQLWSRWRRRPEEAS